MVTKAFLEKANGTEVPTLWGLGPVELHDRFWQAQGIQIVRQGEGISDIRKGWTYLFTSPDFLGFFDSIQALKLLRWLKPRALFFLVEEEEQHIYGEVPDPGASFKNGRIRRIYHEKRVHRTQLCLTLDAGLAQQWSAPTEDPNWENLRSRAQNHARFDLPLSGRLYNAFSLQSVAECARDLAKACPDPRVLVKRARRVERNVWIDPDATVDHRIKTIGPVWIGAGRRLTSDDSVVGPAILWDRPESRPGKDNSTRYRQKRSTSVFLPSHPHSAALESHSLSLQKRKPRAFFFFTKRLFDIVFSILTLTITLPFYPFIMIAILLEDGWPLFFGHRRESLGGKIFRCWKFRTMRKDAEEIKAKLAEENQVDGPQFFIENDPRLTWVGKLLRKFKIDEFPQFFNVLLGDMSVIGPRPSPFKENQFCPAWREARLSVRPGITGLWQVLRTRKKGMDFQEWIRYDIEYVEKANWRLDLWIFFKTFEAMIK